MNLIGMQASFFDISVDDDVYVKFMHPKCPSMLFKWPSKEDEY